MPNLFSPIYEAWQCLNPWWRHQMEIFFALLALSAGNSPVTSEFPTQKPVTRSFGVFFDLRLNNRLSKQSRGWWFEKPSRPLCNEIFNACPTECVLGNMQCHFHFPSVEICRDGSHEFIHHTVSTPWQLLRFQHRNNAFCVFQVRLVASRMVTYLQFLQRASPPRIRFLKHIYFSMNCLLS